MLNRFDDLERAVENFRNERDWTQFHTPKNLAMAICGEAGELAAELQWIDSDDEISEETISRAMDEAADVLLYLISFSQSVNRDLVEAALSKIDKNSLKYPVEKSRGNSTKYNQL